MATKHIEPYQAFFTGGLAALALGNTSHLLNVKEAGPFTPDGFFVTLGNGLRLQVSVSVVEAEKETSAHDD